MEDTFPNEFNTTGMDGDGNLPRYTAYNTGCQQIQSQGAIPPISDGTLGGPFYAGISDAENINGII